MHILSGIKVFSLLHCHATVSLNCHCFLRNRTQTRILNKIAVYYDISTDFLFVCLFIQSVELFYMIDHKVKAFFCAL